MQPIAISVTGYWMAKKTLKEHMSCKPSSWH